MKHKTMFRKYLLHSIQFLIFLRLILKIMEIIYTIHSVIRIKITRASQYYYAGIVTLLLHKEKCHRTITAGKTLENAGEKYIIMTC